MSNSDDLIIEFMNQRTKEVLGEKIDNRNQKSSDNFETAREKAKYYDTKSTNTDNEKALAVAKNTLKTIMFIPLLVGGIIVLLYLIMGLIPTIIKIIKIFFGFN